LANKIEAIKAAKDGLDVLADIRRHAEESTPVSEIPADDLVRMKWYGVFHRQQTPGYFMMRLRTPGGRLTGEQALTIAGIARDFGRAMVDVTTRQNVQLRWLTLGVIPEVWRRLEAVGMTSLQSGMDNVRNYVSCPLAGLDAGELIDTRPIVASLGRAHLGKREFSNLPRKFNVSVTGCREDCGQAQSQDLAFVPATRNVAGRPAAGFNVLVGGALGGTSPRLATPLGAFVRPDDVPPLFLAVLRVFRDHGPREQRTRARLKWLIADWGEPRFREAVAKEFGAPLLGPGEDARRRFAGDHLGVHRQREPGLHYVGLHVPVGRMQAAQLERLARLAARDGNGELRLTVNQNIVIPNVREEHLRRLLAEPLLRELRPIPAPVWRNLVACTGIDYCHYSLIDTKNRAMELAAELERRGVYVPEGTRIHVSGCVHACGKHHIADIGLQGANVRVGDTVEEAVDVYADGELGPDGRLGSKVADKVRMQDLPDAVERILLRDAIEEAS
jgi:ferredoxin-nitrite reductase